MGIARAAHLPHLRGFSRVVRCGGVETIDAREALIYREMFRMLLAELCGARQQLRKLSEQKHALRDELSRYTAAQFIDYRTEDDDHAGTETLPDRSA